LTAYGALALFQTALNLRGQGSALVLREILDLLLRKSYTPLMIERDSLEQEILWQRQDPLNEAAEPGFYEVFQDFDNLSSVAKGLGISTIELEEKLMEGTVFGIQQDGVWVIPRRQFHEESTALVIDEHLSELFPMLSTLMPHTTQSPWLTWQHLFSGSVRGSDEWPYYTLRRDDCITVFLDHPGDKRTALAALREQLAAIDRADRKVPVVILESLSTIALQPFNREEVYARADVKAWRKSIGLEV
jgi:hypothetical protein